jgi:hypothetical protein
MCMRVFVARPVCTISKSEYCASLLRAGTRHGPYEIVHEGMGSEAHLHDIQE